MDSERLSQCPTWGVGPSVSLTILSVPHTRLQPAGCGPAVVDSPLATVTVVTGWPQVGGESSALIPWWVASQPCWE